MTLHSVVYQKLEEMVVPKGATVLSVQEMLLGLGLSVDDQWLRDFLHSMGFRIKSGRVVIDD